MPNVNLSVSCWHCELCPPIALQFGETPLHKACTAVAVTAYNIESQSNLYGIKISADGHKSSCLSKDSDNCKDSKGSGAGRLGSRSESSTGDWDVRAVQLLLDARAGVESQTLVKYCIAFGLVFSVLALSDFNSLKAGSNYSLPLADSAIPILFQPIFAFPCCLVILLHCTLLRLAQVVTSVLSQLWL